MEQEYVAYGNSRGRIGTLDILGHSLYDDSESMVLASLRASVPRRNFRSDLKRKRSCPVPQASLFGSTWQGSLSDLANIVQQVKRLRTFGRLSLRSTDRVSIVHLYFRAGQLAHIVGNRGDVHAILTDLQEWRRASVRFDRGVTTTDQTLNEEHQRLLDEVILSLQRRGVVAVPHMPKVIDSNLIAAPDAQQLITPWEWQVLVEAIRRVSLAVAHLVGPKEALSVLQDILDDCAVAFPAFASFKIAPSGYLQVTDRAQLDHMSREELLEGFSALITICQYFCAPIIGEKDAHKLIIQALQDLAPALTDLGVFHVDPQLLFLRDA